MNINKIQIETKVELHRGESIGLTKYQVFKDRDLLVLQIKINCIEELGWKPQGGITSYVDDGWNMYAQAIVKD